MNEYEREYLINILKIAIKEAENLNILLDNMHNLLVNGRIGRGGL